jgi:putative FmdB family regulatory protein
MPLYEYQCEACSHRFEVIQKFSDAPLDTCPKCGGVVRKLLSSPAFHFKGSGWYITDYARAGKDQGKGETAGDGKSDSKPAAGDSGSESKSDSKAGSGSESKTESKSDSKADSQSDSKRASSE